MVAFVRTRGVSKSREATIRVRCFDSLYFSFCSFVWCALFFPRHPVGGGTTPKRTASIPSG